MRAATVIELGDQQRKELVRLSRGQRVSVRLAQRVRIVLLAADGLQNLQIAAQLGISRFKVSRWRERYATLGLPGIQKDAPRPGRKPKVSADQRRQIVRMTLEEKPANATHWSRDRMAEAATVSASTIERIDRWAHLARAWPQAASHQDLQAFQRQTLRGEARRHRGLVSQSSRARHRALMR